MKRLNWLLCGLIALFVAAGPVLAQEAAPKEKPKKARKARPRRARKPAKPKSLLRGQYAAMAEALKLTREQEEKIAAALKSEQEAIANLTKATAEKDKELAEKIKPLEEQISALRKEQAGLRAERGKISAAREAEVMAALTAEQKEQWKVRMVSSRFVRIGRGIELTDAQKQQIDSLVAGEIKKCEAAGKSTLDRDAQARLRKAIEGTVLTDENRKAMALASLMSSATRSTRRAKLTADQQTKVKALAEQALADLQATRSKIAEMTKEIDALKAKEKGVGANLAKQVEEEVLTAEQREAIKAAAAKAKQPRQPRKKKAGN
jgi:Spy/CpxP family protein refolding chaperone